MAASSTQLQAVLLNDYYKNFSKYAKGRQSESKVAWVTAFTPVEILEALGISYLYPESYAAVIAASGKEQAMLAESDKNSLSLDCCSYSCCIEGSIVLQEAPRGMPPKPDVLIATNNQCNTLPSWWNTMIEKYNVPLIMLDYPGEQAHDEFAYDYVLSQHKLLITEMEKLSGNTLNLDRLTTLLCYSKSSVLAWQSVVDLLSKYEISPTLLFDNMSMLITSRCKPETSELYRLYALEIEKLPSIDTSRPQLFWLGYPLWYHAKRYLADILQNVRICGSNYITWWNLDYSGKDPFEQLYNAYNFTFLNLTQKTKSKKLAACITNSGATGAIVLRNKSCKCDFVSAHNIGLPQAEIEMDMIDREFLNISQAKRQIESLLESL